MAESSGTKSVGLGRCSFSQALADAAEQERTLATAEAPKALLPFGAGCTAIFAAVCVTLKIFEEDPANKAMAFGMGSGWSTRTDSFAALLDACFALASVIGAMVTNDQALLVISKLRPQLRNFEQEGDTVYDDEPTELEDGDVEVGARARISLAFLSFIACFLPLTWFEAGFPALSFAGIAADEMAVIVSASAAAQAAFSFLIAEKFFADAERRVAAQSRQAALSELFFAQAQADSAILGANSAISATSLGFASTAAEFSRACSAVSLWPAVLSTFRSTTSSLASRAEADAAWLESRASQRMFGATAGVDTVSAAVRDLRQLQLDFSLDDFTESVRAELRSLDADCMKDFRGLSTEQRRKVHLVAAELGMLSQSFGLSRPGTRSRSVRVTNILSSRGALADDGPPDEGFMSDFNTFIQNLETERVQILRSLRQRGQTETTLAGLLTALSTASPWLLGSGAAELFLPLATGTVGLCTAWQETAGKGAVATAKRQSAFLLTREARAELFLGRAQLAYAPFPTDLAVATLATTATVLSAEFYTGNLLRWTALSMVIPAMAACSVAMHRRHKVERFASAGMRCVDAKPTPSRRSFWRRKWWLLPATCAVICPCDLSGSATVACAALSAEIALAMSESLSYVADAEGSIARASRAVATAEAWSQLAQFSVRALPARTSLAVVATLVATALVEFSLPLCALFPALGAAVLVRSVQLNRQAQTAAEKLEKDFLDMQKVMKAEPWAQLRRLSGEGRIRLSRERPASRWSFDPGILTRINLNRLRRGFIRLKNVWEDRGPAEAYKPAPAEQAVQSVQRNLQEFRTLTRFNSRTWFRTLSVVGLVAMASVLQPWFLFSSSEVVLPVAGAVLTIFVAASESDARRSVSAAKVKAADIKAATSTLEELSASAMQFRSQLVAWAGVTAATCVLSVISSKHWPLAARYQWLSCAQQCWRLLLVSSHIGAAIASVLPVRAVLLWTSQVRLGLPPSRTALSPSPLEPGAMSRGQLPEGSRWFDLVRGRGMWLLQLLAALPGILLTFFPSYRSFEERTVASTAASSFVVAAMLFLAERALYRAELLIAGRRITFALTDTLANEAEQQSALLPVATAATIAVSAAVTFGVELNPFAASALALLQAITWVLASRKALEAKFGSDAAVQVATVTDGRCLARPGRLPEDQQEFKARQGLRGASWGPPGAPQLYSGKEACIVEKANGTGSTREAVPLRFVGMGCSSSHAAKVHPSGVVPSSHGSPPPASPQTSPLPPAGSAVPHGSSLPVEVQEAVHLPESRPAPVNGNSSEVASPKAKPKAKPLTLIKAIKANDLTSLDELLQSPECNLEVLGMWDNTPLLAACMYGHSEAAVQLIAHGANIFARNEHGATPLLYASVEGKIDVVDALIQAAIGSGAGNGSKLVNCEPAKVYNRHLDAYGQRTPVGAAAESGFVELTRALLDAGALPDEVDEDHRSPLWLAARASRPGVVKLLLQHGADASRCDKDGVSVLGAAAAGGCNEEVVMAILAHGIDVNATAGSPLRDAVKASKKSVVEALLTHGVGVNGAANAGATALHAACERGDEYLVQLLVRSRADPSLNDLSGLTAFDLLRRRGLSDGKIVTLLSPPAASGDDGGTGSLGHMAGSG
ncbi:Ank3 [Symbiodinium natans]|uniref:Ank3 protein n=1 Tax=Symbiodinium natans TaxID=878477 RepID=A0A812NSP2_9DINO|nr:Ank3 [Symbiodinium natans]